MGIKKHQRKRRLRGKAPSSSSEDTARWCSYLLDFVENSSPFTYKSTQLHQTSEFPKMKHPALTCFASLNWDDRPCSPDRIVLLDATQIWSAESGRRRNDAFSEPP